MINLFEKEVADMKALKAQARALFKRREALEHDVRQYDEGEGAHDRISPAAKWLDDICANSEALLRLYIENLATKDWLLAQLTEQAPHCLLDVDGQEAMFNELRAWAEA